MKKEIKEEIIKILKRLTSCYFRGDKFKDQDVYCEVIAYQISELIEQEKQKWGEEILKRLPSSFRGHSERHIEYQRGFNQALQDIKEIIKEI